LSDTTAIYGWQVDPEKFTILGVYDEEDLDRLIDGFEGEPMAADWDPPAVRWRAGDEGRFGDPDFTTVNLMGGIPVLSGRARAALEGLIGDAGEWLPLASEDGDYFALNVLALCDVLDEERSDIRWLGPGRIETLRQFVARDPLPCAPRPIFKLPQALRGRPLVTQEFVDAVLEHGLTGFEGRPYGELPTLAQ
jgi:hypothetical protein